MTIETLAHLWLKMKTAESLATEMRRELEDTIFDRLFHDAPSNETAIRETEKYQIKIAPRVDKKINAEKLQEIAAEHELTSHLSTLFRWRPEIDAQAWKAASEDITRTFAEAITAKPGRPSFQITVKGE